MKHCLVTVFLLLCAFSLRAQDNPYEIDDRCFQYFGQSEALVGKQGFEPVNELLLQSAREAGDKKAETLYYVNALKHIAKYPSTPENDQKVDQAFETLKQAARENGYPQYFYFAYQLAQSYYYNNHQRERALSLVKEKAKEGVKAKDAAKEIAGEFGLSKNKIYSLYSSRFKVLFSKFSFEHSLVTKETFHILSAEGEEVLHVLKKEIERTGFAKVEINANEEAVNELYQKQYLSSVTKRANGEYEINCRFIVDHYDDLKVLFR